MLYAAWCGLFFVLFAESWVSEDAYITLRVVDNFVHGYGLRWNTGERVQVYTHPLWLLLHLPPALLWDNLFFLNIALSLLCASMAIGIVLLTFRHTAPVILAFCLLPLLLSKSFIDYAGSGLETPLSYLLFAALGYALLHWRGRAFFPFAFSLLVSLLLLNRLDHLVMLAPLVAYIAVAERRALWTRRGTFMLALGALPLVAWFAFSLLYYGFVFPNTKYAKLDTGLPTGDYLWQGMQYYFIWLTHDTLSVLVTVLALLLAFLPKTATPLARALALGILLHFAYVLAIGGDYMMGRFFAASYFATVWLLMLCLPVTIRPDRIFAAVLCFLTAFAVSHFVRDIREVCDDCIPVRGRVIDAEWTFGTNHLFKRSWPPLMRREGEYKFARDGKNMARENPPPIKPMRYVGMAGFYAGPHAVIVDELALGNAFLARLPAATNRGFYVGHYARRLPNGYMEAVRGEGLEKMDAGLAEYYKTLRIITEGELFDRERLRVIVRFNLGKYEHYKDHYLKTRR